MPSRIIDQIMQLPTQEWFGEQVVHDLSLLEFTYPDQFDELCESVDSIITFVSQRCPLTIECIQNRIKQISAMLPLDEDEDDEI